MTMPYALIIPAYFFCAGMTYGHIRTHWFDKPYAQPFDWLIQLALALLWPVFWLLTLVYTVAGRDE